MICMERVAREALEFRWDLRWLTFAEAASECAEAKIMMRLTTRELPERTPSRCQGTTCVDLSGGRRREGKIRPVATWTRSAADSLALDDDGFAVDGSIDEGNALADGVIGVHDDVLEEIEGNHCGRKNLLEDGQEGRHTSDEA